MRNYDELLAAAVEAAVGGADGSQDLASWHWGTFHPVEIQHPILGKIPVLQRWTGPGSTAIGQRLYREGGFTQPRAVGAPDRGSSRISINRP